MKKTAPFLATLALALLATLALAACSGGTAAPEATSTPAPTAIATPEATSTPTPTAVATPEAASTPAPTATATPEATSTPAPTAVATPEATSTPAPTAVATPEVALPPEQACANGVAVAEPEANPGLVADCEALLRAKDALRGEASLDWGGGLAVEDWEGVAVSGEPPRVTGLDLRGKGLTGSIPRELRRLRLGEVRLSGNALSGCVPSAFEDASGDAASLGLPWCLRYDSLDAAGEVAGAGEWAILGGNGDVLTTWEQLRSEAATLRVHQTDAGGNSWASEFGAVAVNDLFEWRIADDCWVRYRVTGAPAPPSGASGRWEFPVAWMTYAATGVGCTGEVGAGTVFSVDEEPAVIQSPRIASPVRHGLWLMVPTDWSGRREPAKGGDPLRATGNAIEAQAATVAGASDTGASPWFETSDASEARRRIPNWRDPALPAGWRLRRAEVGTGDAPPRGYMAEYEDAQGYLVLMIYVVQVQRLPVYQWAVRGSDDNRLVTRLVTELLVIDGHAGLVSYSPPGPHHNPYADHRVQIYDEPAGVKYWMLFNWGTLRDAIEIARSMYRTPSQ